MIRKSHAYCLPIGTSLTITTPAIVNGTKGPYMGVAPVGLMEGIGATHGDLLNSTGRQNILPSIRQIFESLPVVHLDYRENPCYAAAAKYAYHCYRRNSRGVYLSNRDMAHDLKRLVFSMRCTYQQLARKCNKKRAFLLTILEYDWLIVPPPLDINIGYSILRTWRMKL
ncbi:hypothetical protein PoB_002251500 [Plakobranchus ocellatus]|uniref:Uncharacterized protein n=1 Tax=Plakobranchus ocellatus TaxID=259542 RepID=A0AAV3ZN52_9GAST|nr:hypothetical protein PoB_002251500 [Plakobranchus ocellatus]